MRFMCHCGELVSTNATPAPETFSVIGTADEEESLESWAHAAAEYVTAVRNGHRDSWMAQHFSHLPDASDSEVLSDLLTKYLLPHQRLDIICPACGRLWRQDAPGGSAHRSFLPEG
ncbi:hypothetical protein [Mycobacterium sp. UM_WWY]